MGKVATSPLPYRGSPPLQSGGQNQSWPTSGQSGYLTPAVSGIPTASERGAKSELAHKWAKWLPHPCRIGDPHRFRAGGKSGSGPQVVEMATSPLPYRGSAPLQSGGQNQKWPTSGESAYLTPAVSGIPTASERGAKSEVAHKWAKWLPHPCRIGDPHRFRAGGKIRSGPQVVEMATSPLPYRGSPAPQKGGQNQSWPTSGQSGYLTPAVSGIPTASERGAKAEVAHKWSKWLPHPCRIGDPHRFRAGGKIRSGPQVGKVPTSPPPYRGSPPLQSGGQNQKWPTSGQSGYLTPAVSGIPTASERGAKSEVAHKWAKWLPHPCRIGDPHRFRAGGKSGSGPQVVEMATSPLPYRGSPPLQSGGQNQKWPTSGQSGYLTPAVSGIPTASERGAKSEVAHKWAKWLPHPCCIGDPHRFRAGGKIRSGPQVGKVATSALPYRGSPPLQSGGQNQKWPTSGRNGCRIGDPHRFRAGGKIRSGPQVGKMATSPLPYRGSPPLQSGGQNQKWPTSGQSGYLTPAVSGIPTASERGAKSEVAHKWSKWLPHPCRIGDPHRFRAGGKIRSGPQVGKVATSPLPYRGSPPLQSGGQNQKWPTSGQSGFLTPAVSGIPTASERGAKSEVAHKWAKWLPHPCRIGDPHRFRAGGKIGSGPRSGQSGYLTPAVSGIRTASERGAKSEVAHKWSKWLPHPCRIRDPHRFRAGGKIGSGPQVVEMATSPLPYRGSPPLQSGGQNQKWPTSGESAYLTPAVSGIPTASERGAKSEVAHKWAKWLPHPCRIGDPHRFRAGGKIRSGPQVGKVATSPLPYRGSPPLQSGGQKRKWPTSGRNGYLTPAVSGIPTASERGAKSEVAHKWSKWLPHPCRIRDPHRFRAGGKIGSGPQVVEMATSPLPYRGSPPLQSGGQNQKWPTSGESAYLTPAVSGIPTASERGAKSEVAHKWAKWLPHPCRIGDPHRFRAGGKIRSGPQVGKVATSPLPYRGSPPLQSGGQKRKWPTSGRNGYLTPAVSGIPTASERGAKSEVAHKWGKCLPHPCRIGDPHRFRAGGKIRSGPQVGKVATSPLLYRGSPPLQSGGQNQKWPTSGQSGYLTPAVSGIPTASERGAKSEVAHKWAKWLPHPCCIGDPHRFRAGGKIRSGPQVGKVATSPLPYRGSPPLQSGGQNQKWPTSGRNGCRIGDPHRFRAGGKIRSGPQVGKMATSPLPYRGSPPLQSGGQNQKWPTSGQSGYLIPAVSGIPTASERGAKSEVAHKWSKWLPHPCRIGDPHRFRAGGKIRSGPQVGKVATSPLPYRGSAPLQSGGQNQKWPTSGQSGFLTPAVSGIPTASERGAKSEVAHKWAKWLPHPCRIGDPHRFRAGGKVGSGPRSGQSGYLTPAVSGIRTASERGAKSEVAHKWSKWLPHPCRIRDPHRFRAGGKSGSGPQVGKVATSPLPYRGSAPLQSGGQNQKWPTSGQSGYRTPAVSGIPTASERGAKSESGPQVGKVATSPLPYRGSPPLQSGGQNQKWPTSGRNGYLTPAVSGIPTASERGAKSEVAHKWGKCLPHPRRIGDPHRFRAGGKIRSGPQVGKVATSPLPYRGSPPLQSGGQKRKWPTSGRNGYLTPAVSGIPTASERGAKSEVAHTGQSGYLTPAVSGIPTASERGAKAEVAHKWSKWLPHPCRIGDPHRFRAGGKIRSGPQVVEMATSPLLYRGSAPLQSGGQNQKWPTSGQSGYLTPAVSGIPTASERGAKSEVAHKWAKWLPHPCRIRDPHRFRAGGKIRSGPQVVEMATSPLPYRGSPPLQSGGQNQKWPTSGQSGYLTPAVSGIPTASERGAKSEVAHKWAKWLPHPRRIGDPHRFRAGGKIRSSPQVGKVATSPLPYRGSPPLQSGGQNWKWPTKWAKWLPHPCRIGDPHRFRAGGKIRSGPQVVEMATSPLPYKGSPPLQSGGQKRKWPTSGQSGYLTPAVSGICTASERGAKSEVAHKWAKWLPHPCRIGDPHRFRAGGKIRKWPTSGQSGYLTPAVSGIPTASERGAKSEVAHKWSKWLPHPCRIGDPHRFRAGGKIRSGPQVGKVPTSPPPYRGSPPLQSGGQNQKWPTSGQSGYLTPAVSGIPTASERGAKAEVAHKWSKWLPHPCRIGDPHRFRAGGKIRSGPQLGKVATSPLPYRGSPPLQSGGQKRKWPTSGRNGYLTPAVSGIPTASERGAKSEVAHKWSKWLPHPCCIGDPHRFRAGGKIRSGPQVGKVATSPLPYRGSPPLQSGGQNQKWPTSGQSGYLTPAVSGIPTASERGAKAEVAHKWSKWLPHPCRIGDPHRFRAGGKIRSGPQVVEMATSPLPYRGSPPLQSGGQNQKWPTSGQNGYLTPAVSGIRTASERGAKSEVAHKWAKWLPHPCRIGDPHRFRAGGKIRSGPQVVEMAAVSGIPTASERGAKSEVAHKWAKWLPHPCRIGDPHRFRAGGKIRSGPQVGKVATSSLPYQGSPPLQSGGQNQKWPTSGRNGYLTPAVSGIPTASERGAKSEVAHKWAKWLPHPCRIGDPHRFRAGGKIGSGPRSGQSGYLTPAVSGIRTASERGAKSEVAHKWSKWLPHPCRIRDPHRFRAGGKIGSGPQVGKVATSPLPYRGSAPLQSGGQNQKWPTSGQSGYRTPAVSGIPTASERGAKSESGPQVGKVATSPLPYRGSPPLQSGGQNQKWPTSGRNGYLTPAVSGIPTASERGAKSEVAHKWGKCLPHPRRIGDPHRFRAGGKIRSGPQVGKVATSPLPYRGSPPLQSGGQKRKWPTSGRNGYLTPAVSGIPTASERGAKSEVAHNWAKWLPHPCRIGDPHRFRAGGKSGSGPQVVEMATSPLPYRGSPPLQSGGQNQKWPTSGRNGYLTPAVSGIRTASERGAKSEVAHKWAKWLPHPCRIGDPHRFRAGGKIRSGPQVGKVATSPLPYRGSAPLQSGGQNQKWPTSGQSGYRTPAVSGIPTASERGAKSEVAHKWGKWLPHPCCIGDPHRFRAGGKIRSGPQVGKVATSPLPYRGSPPLHSGGQNQKVAHKWAKWLPHPCRIGDPHRFRAGGKIRSGPQVGKVATSPLPYRGSPPLQSGGQNQKWPTSGQSGYLTLAVSGIPTASERGAKSEVAHKWAKWLPHPCRIGDPHRFRAGGKIRSGPQVGKVATSPLPYRGSPPLQSGGQNQKWPTSGQNGYLTPDASRFGCCRRWCCPGRLRGRASSRETL